MHTMLAFIIKITMCGRMKWITYLGGHDAESAREGGADESADGCIPRGGARVGGSRASLTTKSRAPPPR
jgi:hypothetical protein